MAEVIGVRFKNVGKVYYFDPAGVQMPKEAQRDRGNSPRHRVRTRWPWTTGRSADEQHRQAAEKGDPRKPPRRIWTSSVRNRKQEKAGRCREICQ